MKYLIIALLLLSACNGSKEVTQTENNNTNEEVETNQEEIEMEETAYFRIIEATKQRWVGGRQESGYGTVYIVRVKMLREEIPEFTTIWIGDDHYKPRLLKTFENMNKEIGKGDEAVVEVNVITNPYDKDQIVRAKIPKPYQSDSESILQFKVEDKIFYENVMKFKELERLVQP